MNNDANFKNINSQQNNNSNSFEKEIENLENKYGTEYKIKRIHRISPSNKLNDNEEEKVNSISNYNIRTPSNKKNRKQIDDDNYNEEKEKEIKKRKKINDEFMQLYSQFKITKNFQDDTSFNESNKKDSFKKQEIYYIITKTWLNQFKNYASKTNFIHSNINEDYPGQINNQHLILKDDSCLKLNTEKRLILNPKYSDNCTCISQDLWLFFVRLCGGGPEIKFIPNKLNNNLEETNEINTIKKGVHINLFFIPKKQIISNNNNKEPSDNILHPLNPFQCQDIKKVLKITDINNKIKKEKIYFDISKNVKELINYINKILNQHRDKFTNTPIFFGPCFNSEGNNNLVENLNYRLWLIYTDIDEDKIINNIQDKILKYEDADFLMNFTQINDDSQNTNLVPYLLTDFIEHKISDIFPNKYTKNFNNKEYYSKIEDNNAMPVMNIVIEENPYHFDNPKKKYYIRKCSECQYRDYTFIGCQCQKVYYCSEGCKKNNLVNHIVSCKIGLYNRLLSIQANLSKIILGRKDYYEKNKNEEKKFPILGLTNLGNSCYMNSGLQCLFATKELSEYFLYYFDEKNINKDNILGTGGLITLAYACLLLHINNTTNNKYFTPDVFKIILGLCSKKFEGNEQEDAHEFINYLLDMLHEDLNKVNNKLNNNENNININYDNNRKYTDEEKSQIYWSNFLRRNQSLLIDLFYGQLKSCVKCPKCDFSSINFNSFLSLELGINANKNYQIINIEFLDYYEESPRINFSIILYHGEMKVYFIRKKIANLLNIDLLSFELSIIIQNKIIHTFDLNEEITPDIKNVIAFRINPAFFYSEKNERHNEIINHENSEDNINNTIYSINNKYKIDFDNLEHNVNKRRREIIKYNENNNKSISDDFLSLNLLYKDNIGLNNSEYQRLILQSFIVSNRNLKNLEKDEIIYLEKNKTCAEIYFEIFKKYVANIVVQNFPSEARNKFLKFYSTENNEKIEKKLLKYFNYFFKNIEIHPSKVDIINDFPKCPFLLFLNNEKYKVKEIIPVSKEINYFEILKIFYDGINFEKNKYNQIREYNSIKKNNDSKKEKLENDNEENNLIIDTDLITNLLNDNNKECEGDDKNDIKKGLKGGYENESDDNKIEGDSDSGSQGSEETDNNNENEYIDNSENDLEILGEDNLGSYSNDYNNSPNMSPRRLIRFPNNEFDNLIKLKNEKDENMDRITIVFNRKFIREISRFNDINLYDICDKMYEKSTNQETNLEKLLEDFSKEEKLDKDNLYTCENCKMQLEANKTIEIFHLPKILIIHLKRFNNNKKINTLIEFPLVDLNLNKYVKSNDTISKYNLYGVINHFGSLEYGHYTAFCLNYHDNSWYEYNDRIVNKIQKGKEKEIIVNKNAYILFYRSEDNNNIDWESLYKKQYEIINENNLKKFGENIIYLVNQEENEKIETDNEIKEQGIFGDKNEIFIFDDKENENNSIEKIEDDNFSFKEGMNNKSITNIAYEDNNNNENNSSPLEETPKFKNKFQNEEEIKGSLINFNLNESDNTNMKETNDIKNNEYKTEIKKSYFNNEIIITRDNTLRIRTFVKPRKKENNDGIIKDKNEPKKENKFEKKENKKENNENELLKYNIFNQNKNYFKLNPKESKRGIQSLKNKELSLFFLQEISDNKSNKVPRSKKLYDEINMKKDSTKKEQLNNIKEDINIKETDNKELNLQDYVFNPFRQSFLKLKKFENIE